MRKRLPRLFRAALNAAIPGLGMVHAGRFRSAFAALFLYELLQLLSVPAYLLSGALSPEPWRWGLGLLGRLIAVIAGLRMNSATEETNRRQRMKVFLIFLALAFLLSAIVEAVTRVFWQPHRVPDAQMEPTFLRGDRISIDKRKATIDTNSLILFRSPLAAKESKGKEGLLMIGRIVGAPKQSVWIKNKRLFVNATELSEPYVVHRDTAVAYPALTDRDLKVYQERWETGQFVDYARGDIGDHFGPVVVPEGQYFVLGDDRDRAYDSRYFGPVPRWAIIGTVRAILAPPHRKRRFE
jgi:signal peptidase I